MLDTLIQSKTRLKLVLRFFLNPESSAYLRGLAQEFNESTNSVRIELNRFEEAGLISSNKVGNKKVYQVNKTFPLYNELQALAFKHLGIDKIINQVVTKIGTIQNVYLTGNIARGIDTEIIDVVFYGDNIDTIYLAKLIGKAEKILKKKIRTIVYSTNENILLEEPYLLIFGEE